MNPALHTLIRDALDWAWQQPVVMELRLPAYETLLRGAQRNRACHTAVTRLADQLGVDMGPYWEFAGPPVLSRTDYDDDAHDVRMVEAWIAQEHALAEAVDRYCVSVERRKALRVVTGDITTQTPARRM